MRSVMIKSFLEPYFESLGKVLSTSPFYRAEEDQIDWGGDDENAVEAVQGGGEKAEEMNVDE